MSSEGYTIKEASATRIRKTIDEATSSKDKIPGFVFVAVNKNGDEIFSHASGKRGAETKEPMTLNSVFWIASCTKMVGGIACMQLVEQGKLSLDDADLVGKLAPELKKARILDGFDEKDRPIWKEKKTGITLRHLLSHTSGLGYTFFNPELKKVGLPRGIDEFSGRIEDLDPILLFEPGSKFNYGTGIDWACVLVERVTGQSLSEYINANVFSPLSIKNMSFFPPQSMKDNLAHMHQRYPDGHITTREHLLRGPLYANTPEQQKNIFNSAGAGLFAQPREYVKIIATLLNNGTSPNTGKQILKAETVNEMFSNQIPNMPNFGREAIQAATPELTNPIPELYPQPKEQEQGWGLTFMLTIHPGATGRGANTGWWAGLPNLFWWADREKGVGGMVASQIVPFADAEVMGLWAGVESAIYQG
ncbi:hypothetical protein IFR04_010635 [Cadophora malorum]|uniref:Beta-lactamase-related domain-containing protein n=1 Tax=Cadophora malorum TaxID=108018 RepID=A0A8H7W5M8_9HELO|nr:hypothetical protein IFR04_010635 [Cadophora malorum]